MKAPTKLKIGREELVKAFEQGTERELIAKALRDVGLSDCSDCAKRLLDRLGVLKAKIGR